MTTVTARRPIDPHVRLGVLRRDGYRCGHCFREVDRSLLEIDHIVPLSLGGTDDPSNLQTLCRTCNRRKGNRYIG